MSPAEEDTVEGDKERALQPAGAAGAKSSHLTDVKESAAAHSNHLAETGEWANSSRLTDVVESAAAHSSRLADMEESAAANSSRLTEA